MKHLALNGMLSLNPFFQDLYRRKYRKIVRTERMFQETVSFRFNKTNEYMNSERLCELIKGLYRFKVDGVLYLRTGSPMSNKEGI